MKYNFIINPHAGGGQATTAISIVQDLLDKYDIGYTTQYTTHRMHAKIIAQDLIAQGVDNIIAVGGDGTLNEIVAGIGINTNVTLGLIPAGTGNDFARSNNMELHPILAMENILKERIQKIDLIDISNRYMLCFGNAGIDARLVQIVNNSKKKNKASYVKALLKCLVKFDWYKYNITIDGKDLGAKEGLLVCVLGGKDLGSGIKICKTAKVDDGLMDVVFVGKTKNKLHLLPMFISLLTGKLLENKSVEHYICKTANIDLIGHNIIDIDGELLENINRMDCTIYPASLSLYNTK